MIDSRAEALKLAHSNPKKALVYAVVYVGDQIAKPDKTEAPDENPLEGLAEAARTAWKVFTR